jgi:hypothetical protein
MQDASRPIATAPRGRTPGQRAEEPDARDGRVHAFECARIPLSMVAAVATAVCAEHDRKLAGGSPLSSLMVAKDIYFW